MCISASDICVKNINLRKYILNILFKLFLYSLNVSMIYTQFIVFESLLSCFIISCFSRPLHASMFAMCSAGIGLTTLYLGTNTLTAILGATNLILYTSIYTPMKRYSIANTWLGSIVGAIPPLMGWAACTGTLNSGWLMIFL